MLANETSWWPIKNLSALYNINGVMYLFSIYMCLEVWTINENCVYDSLEFSSSAQSVLYRTLSKTDKCPPLTVQYCTIFEIFCFWQVRILMSYGYVHCIIRKVVLLIIICDQHLASDSVQLALGCPWNSVVFI